VTVALFALLAAAHAAPERLMELTVLHTEQGAEILVAMPLSTSTDASAPLLSLRRDGRVPEGLFPDARMRSIIAPDGGHGEAAWLTSALSTEVVRVPADVDLAPWTATAPAAAPPPENAFALLQSGPSAQRLDVVFLGDGYTADQQEEFAADVAWMADYMLSIEPYASYAAMFNVWRVDLPSNQSGSSHPELGEAQRDTVFSCAYGCSGLDRLICCNDAAVLEAAEAVPQADGIVVLINDETYGGSGGFNYATSFVGESQGREVAIHEVGHSLVGLWDEYGYGISGDPGTDGEGANCSASPDGHWTVWQGIQGVGAHQECSFTNYHRPTENACMMRTLQDDYCAVCRQETIYGIYARLPGLVNRIEPAEGTEIVAQSDGPAATFTIDANEPSHGLVYAWSVDGEQVEPNDKDFDLKCSGLKGELTLHVYDDTPWVRTDPYGLTFQILGPWTVRSQPCASICGCSGAPSSGGGGWLLVALLALWRRR
jgi:MYXO-CTERM domain-containing protein